MWSDFWLVVLGGLLATGGGAVSTWYAGHLSRKAARVDWQRRGLERLIELCAVSVIDVSDTILDAATPSAQQARLSLSLISELEVIVELHLPEGKGEATQMASAINSVSLLVQQHEAAQWIDNPDAASKTREALRTGVNPALKDMARAAVALRDQALVALRATT